MAAPEAQLKRRVTGGGFRRWVRPGGEQHAADFFVPFLGGKVERRPGHRASHRHVAPAINQELERRYSPVPRRQGDRVVAVVREGVHVGAAVHQQREDFDRLRIGLVGV